MDTNRLLPAAEAEGEEEREGAQKEYVLGVSQEIWPGVQAIVVVLLDGLKDVG